jgi:pimeloyl-ACP methyl ester carboxylesterase
VGLERACPAAATWLAAHPQQVSLVSWTPLFYDSPQDIATDLPALERLLASPEPSRADRREIDSLVRRARRLWHVIGDSFPPLTRLMASAELRSTLNDVRRYIDDVDGVGTRIRALLKAALRHAWAANERVLLIGHSLGSVIAYDSLWELSRGEEAPGRVERLVTLGSPLATRFIRKALKGAGRVGSERFPGNIARWENFTARGEMVALHPRLAPFFGRMVELGLCEAMVDHPAIYNAFHGPTGINVHKCYAYMSNADVARVIGDWLVSASSDGRAERSARL